MNLIKLSLITAILVMGCASTTHQTPPTQPVAPKASQADCDKVYSQLINIGLVQVHGSLDDLTPEEFMTGSAELDTYYTNKGAKREFYSACLGQFNANELSCMRNAWTFDAIGLCHQLLKD